MRGSQGHAEGHEGHGCTTTSRPRVTVTLAPSTTLAPIATVTIAPTATTATPALAVQTQVETMTAQPRELPNTGFNARDTAGIATLISVVGVVLVKVARLV